MNRKYKLIFLLVFVICGVFLFTKSSQAATNLVENGDAETGDLSGWTVSSGVGYTWAFNWNMPPHSGDYDFSSSYNWPNTMEQTVDLVAAGYTAGQLDASPNIDYSVWISQRFDHAGQYRLTFQLQDASYSAVATKYIDDNLGDDALNNPIALTAGTAWHEQAHTFSGYSSGVRYAYIKIEADDGAANWGGNYGATFDDISISIADTTAPTVSYLSPADNATSVDVDVTFEIAFDEAIATSTGDVVLYKVSDDSVVETIDIEDTSGKVTASSTTALIIDPSTTLDSETEYYFTFASSTIDDTSGNSFAGVTTTEWSFTTADVQDPTASTLLPADNATGVAIDSNLVVTFSEIVVTSTGNVVIYTSVGAEVESIDITSTQVTGYGTSEFIISPSSDFNYETSYYVFVSTTAFDDSSGNSYAGITVSTTWSFTTEDTPTCPTISNAATYNAYPTCGVATCDSGYTLSDGSCVANSSSNSSVFIPPSVPKIVIPPSFTSDSVNLSVSNVEQMAISETEDFSGISWEPYNESYKISIKKLYIKFRSLDGGVSEVYEVQGLEFGVHSEGNVNGNNYEGKLIKYIDSPKVYIVKDGKRCWITNEETFNYYNYNWQDINMVDIDFVDGNSISKNMGNVDYVFTRNLELGMSGEDVKELQKYLNKNGFLIDTEGVGSPGQESLYFGELTKQALIKFQQANNLPAFGFFGPLTRSLILK